MDRKFPAQLRRGLAKPVQASARPGPRERLPQGSSQRHPCAAFVSGTFQQVTNLLNIMDSESAKTEAVGAGPDMRKTLASVIITEKATAEPCVVMNALIRCLQVPEVGPPRPQPLLGAQRLWPLVRPPAAQHTGAGLGAGVQRGAGQGESLLLEDAGEPGVFTISKSSSDTVGLGALLLEQEQSRRTCGSKDRADQSSGTPGPWGAGAQGVVRSDGS